MNAIGRSPLLEWLEAARPARIAGLVALLVAAVGAADWLSTADVGFTFFYLLPIALAAWCLGPGAVGLTVLTRVIAWLSVHLVERTLALPPAIEAFNVTMELIVFMSFGLLLASLRRRLDAERRLARTDPL